MKSHPVELAIERGLFFSRWLMAPMYIGLVGGLLLLMYSFFAELIHLFASLTSLTQNDIILGILSLIDLSLAGNLLLIVIFSGYENFVSKINTGGHEDQFEWKGTVDFSTLKLKLIASIVAISGIHLLKVFMDPGKMNETQTKWMVIIHVVFVISGVLLALMDRIVVSNKMAKAK
jgi:uncharacterized protein (TIGR00645 family)